MGIRVGTVVSWAGGRYGDWWVVTSINPIGGNARIRPIWLEASQLVWGEERWASPSDLKDEILLTTFCADAVNARLSVSPDEELAAEFRDLYAKPKRAIEV